MKILYTHRTQGVGAEGVHIMGMVEAFRQLGNQVEMDCLPDCDPFEKNRASGEAAKKNAAAGDKSLLRTVYALISERAPQFVFGIAELLYNIPLAWRLWKRIRSFRPDFIYERYALSNFAPALLCRLLGIRLVIEVNDSVVIERSRPLSLPWIQRWLERKILMGAEIIITISEKFKSKLLDAFPLDGSRILVCPNAVSEERFVPITGQAAGELRATLPLRGRTLLGSAGQFVPWHGLPEFISMMAESAEAEDLGFLFIGDGPVRPDILSAAQAKGISDRIHFTGMLPHALVPRYLSLLDVAVIPFSNIHGSPMKLMEFMAMGLPVVAPDLPPIQEVLQDRVTGRIFPSGDLRAMRRCLTELLSDPTARSSIGRNARNYVLGHLTWKVHAEKILRFLDS